jgi:hypothetical protein
MQQIPYVSTGRELLEERLRGHFGACVSAAQNPVPGVVSRRAPYEHQGAARMAQDLHQRGNADKSTQSAYAAAGMWHDGGARRRRALM